MSQLFTIFFPKFWFDVPSEHDIEFEDRNRLPFEYVSDGGAILVDKVLTQPLDPDSKLSQLHSGLRIVAINQESITDAPTSRQQFERMLQKRDDDAVSITFRQDMNYEQHEAHRAFGLGHKQPDIADEDIVASSFEPGFEPFRGRLCNPDSCWRARATDSCCFLQIDLNATKQISRMHIQGDTGHTCYCKSIWVDWSADGAEWKSWSKREIKLVYDAHGMAVVKVWPIIMARFIRIRPHKWVQAACIRASCSGCTRPRRRPTCTMRAS